MHLPALHPSAAPVDEEERLIPANLALYEWEPEPLSEMEIVEMSLPDYDFAQQPILVHPSSATLRFHPSTWAMPSTRSQGATHDSTPLRGPPPLP